jgi:hypothetical protein
MERTSKQVDVSGAGYLCFQSASEGAEEWAALLVVSAHGLPQEFLYSGPLRPTPVQTILYQDQLASQVRLSLVRSLLRGLRSRLLFLAVRVEELDGALLEALKGPVLGLSGDTGEWLREPVPAAEALRARLEEVVGVAEPLGRAVAALAYVVEYERSQSSR